MDSPDRPDAAVYGLTDLANPGAAGTGSRSYADHCLFRKAMKPITGSHLGHSTANL